MSDPSNPHNERVESLPSAAGEAEQTVQKVISATTEEVRGSVREGVEQARKEGLARTEDAKSAIAQEVGATAEALDAASRDLQEHSLQRALLGEVSRGLNGVASALEGRSVSELLKDIVDLGRRNPAAFLGGAALAGFAVARLATASAHTAQSHGTSRPATSESDSWRPAQPDPFPRSANSSRDFSRPGTASTGAGAPGLTGVSTDSPNKGVDE